MNATKTGTTALLVTSRERLRVQGEWIIEVGGLPAPPDETSAISGGAYNRYYDADSADRAEGAGRHGHAVRGRRRYRTGA
jgi:hypothetical protein